MEYMGRLLRWIPVVFALAPVLFAAEPQTRVKLLLSHEVARPGETITAALEVSSNPKWHTYWRNPGDAGIATTVKWDLPAGITAGEIQWPVPHKMTLIGLSAYVYEGTEYLLVPLKVSDAAKPGDFTLKADVAWLECAEQCIDQKGSVANTLTIGSESKPSLATSIIENARGRLPKSPAPFTATAKWDSPGAGEERVLSIQWEASEPAANPDFYPFESTNYTAEGATTNETSGNNVVLKKKFSRPSISTAWPASIHGLVINDSSAEKPIGYEMELKLPAEVGGFGAFTNAAVVSGGVQFGPPEEDTSFIIVLGLAFLGGLILNIMPCVLPVIALKILSFVNQSGSDPRRARQLGLIYALGVLASFAVLAGIVIAVQKTGEIASWGMQFQSPVFLVVMITLVTLIGLNLFGVFEITLGGKAMGAASELSSREGPAGAFFNGILATVLGTSCTAPFLTFAVGYALSQSAIVTILLFLMMGVGLAFPYVVFTWNPKLLRIMPKPGAWMEKFKVAMGFPMLATAIWLYSVAVKAHFAENGAFWLATFLLLVSFSVWIYGAFVQRGRSRKPFGVAMAAVVLALAVGGVLEKKLQWRNPVYAKRAATVAGNNGVDWKSWSPEAVAAARAEGRPILVDFTADWCFSCKVNLISSIEIESVEKKLREINAVALLGDFTGKDPAIAQELKKFKRSAVPLVLVYPSDSTQPPLILPAILTPNIVLEALDQAAGKSAASSLSMSDR